MSSPRKLRRFSAGLALLSVTLPAALAQAEGSAQVGTNQDLQATEDRAIGTNNLRVGRLGVDIFAVNEDVTWTGNGSIEIWAPSADPDVDAPTATLTSGQTFDTTEVGAHFIEVLTDQGASAWDITVSGTASGYGRLFSESWLFFTGTFGLPDATSASFYALVPAGESDKTGVIQLALDGMSGNRYVIAANQRGVDGAIAGRSVPQAGNGITPQYRVYLNPPEVATYDPVTPVASALDFSGGPLDCNQIGTGVSNGTFEFDSNITGTYHLVCDLNGDSIYNRVGSEDFLYVGLADPGTNTATWNGLDNAGNPVPDGDYECRVFLNTGEMHYVAWDVETAYQGLRMFEVASNLSRIGLFGFWNDSAVQGNAINMPNGELGSESSGASGINAGLIGNAASADGVTTAGNAHAWGNFTAGGKGNDAFIDTFAFLRTTATGTVSVTTIDPAQDSDSDTLPDYVETCEIGTDPNDDDTDGDGIRDDDEVGGGSGVDSDSDGVIDALDADSDNDGITDAEEGSGDFDGDLIPDVLDLDSDNDGIPDIVEQQLGAFDTDGDGRIDDNTDTDGDGLADVVDSAPADPGVATSIGATVNTDGLPDGADRIDLDSDEDGVPDVVEGGGVDINLDDRQDTTADANDNGLDDAVEPGGSFGPLPIPNSDGLGAPDFQQADADGDGVVDGSDNNPQNPLVCSDVDSDLCDDCSGGAFDLSSDGPDNDSDGLCNSGDPDDDDDGALDATDSDDNNPFVCVDADLDSCDECSSGTLATTTTDGIDTDLDGVCDAGDTDDDNDGVLDGSDTDDTDPTVCADADLDSCDDCAITGADNSGGSPINDGADFDADGLCDVGDVDDDNDGVLDGPDTDEMDPNICADVDSDGCDDCAITGADNSGGDTENDGVDSDIDGICDAGDVDDDNDGVANGTDTDDADPNICADTDSDGCDDCSQTGADNSGGDAANDGTDLDEDGICATTDPDDDGDGVDDEEETDGTDPSVCSDIDADGCDDCSSGTFDVDSDGTDTDGDGLCDIGDTDDDGDGVLDSDDSDPADQNVCRDADADTCDDCASGSDDASDDGTDSDGDGLCDVGEEASGSDPNDRDSDDDGVPDADELEGDQDTDGDGLINRNDPDSDNDGLTDGTELGLDCSAEGTDVSRGFCTPDADGGVTVTDPLAGDTDGGGVTDGSEDTNLNGRVDDGESSPVDGEDGDDSDVTDSDGDGLSDELEELIGSDPNDGDSDDDGLLDGDEPNPTLDMDGDGLVSVLDVDSDNDGLFDGTETGRDCDDSDTDASLGHCRADADTDSTTSPLDSDSDDGGVSDGSEDANLNGRVDSDETDPTTGNGGDDGDVVDSDGDGLSDDLEDFLGTDKNDSDSDDDGISDGNEPNPSDDHDGDGDINSLDSDSDDDGLFDGTEVGNDCSADDIDQGAESCRADADGGETTTGVLDPDTDDGGIRDGQEDTNHNGRVDEDETDPNDENDDPDCTMDSECGDASSGMICDTGSCAEGCRGEGGNSCADGQECSSNDETRGECQEPDVDATPPEEEEFEEQPLVRGGGLQCSTSPRNGGTRSPLWVLLGLGLFTLSRRRRAFSESA